METTEDERTLINNYRRCRKADRDNLLWLAELAARAAQKQADD